MVSPVTGPFTRTATVLGPPNSGGHEPVWKYKYLVWYRQRRPYNRPLTHYSGIQEVISFTPWDPIYYASASECPALPWANPSTWFASTYNKAYERFVAKIKPDTAGLGVGLAQRQQSLGMIANRGLQMANFARSLRKGDFGKAASYLGITERDPRRKPLLKKVKRGSKNFANNFLEYQFGWAPLVGDIGSAVDILQSGVPPTRVRASATGRTNSLSTRTSGGIKETFAASTSCTWSLSATIVVDNPNLWLANQLGLVNPALIAYDAVPFSFVLNWFVNVENFLSSFTDFWGLSVIDPYITSHSVTTSDRERYFISAMRYDYGRFQTVETRRLVGSIPGPTLRQRSPWVLKPQRAATAISLLLQKLR